MPCRPAMQAGNNPAGLKAFAQGRCTVLSRKIKFESFPHFLKTKLESLPCIPLLLPGQFKLYASFLILAISIFKIPVNIIKIILKYRLRIAAGLL